MFAAVIETGGKQYKVSEGDVIFVEKLGLADGEKFTIDKVLAVIDENGALKNVGAPYVEGASVSATVLASGRSKKLYVIKYKAKKNQKKKIGHRQHFTKIQIDSIVG